MAKPEGPKNQAGRAERGGVLGEAKFPSHQLGSSGSAVSSSRGVRGFLGDLAIQNVL